MVVSLALEFLKKYWKYLAVIIALGALIGMFRAVLNAEYANGKAAGYQSGYQTAWDKQQGTIDSLVTAQNKQNEANNKSIAELEKQSSDLAQKNQDLQKLLDQKRTEVVTKYVKTDPQSAASCGIDAPMAKALNELLRADPSIVVGGSK